MDHESLDPYEQQLFAVFDTHDLHHTGTLDHEGLSQLCTALQLDDCSSDLIHCLLTKSKNNRVTFYEFKDALLSFLSEKPLASTDIINDKSESDGESSDREISPKYVYGAKKYGRRTRPHSGNLEDTSENGDSEKILSASNSRVKQNKVQRSSSQSDVHPSKKRKGNSKLKRCTSFPDATNYASEWNDYNPGMFSPIASSPERQCDIEEKMMQEIWERLGVGKNGYLNKEEMVIVCEYIGMNRIPDHVAKQLFKSFSLESDRQISFNSFVDIFHNSQLSVEQGKRANENRITEDQNTFQKSNFSQCITLGPDGSGTINSDILIEMWESAGIVAALDLLTDLGFSKKEISVSELANVLEEELHNLTDQQEDMNQPIAFSTNPHIALLQASLALYQSELRCLKSVMEHMNAEREKLKNDIVDANQRASLLAQEVDDNHAKMEKSTKEQVRHLEQRHADIVRELTEQLAGEREQACLLNSKLERRVATLEAEETKLKIELLTAQRDLTALEKENHNLLEQVSNLEKTNAHLLENVTVLENEKQKMCDIEGNRELEQMRSYLEKISALQLENTTLRDRNDELSIELETVSAQLSAMKLRKTNNSLSCDISDENISVNIDLPINAAMKRRGESSSKINPTYNPEEEESPRTGKLRCYQSKHSLSEGINVLPYNASESGLDVDFDYADSSVSITSCESGIDEVPRLYAKIAQLETLLAQHGYDISTDSSLSKLVEDTTQSDDKKLLKRCQYLEQVLKDIKIDLIDRVHDSGCTADCLLKKHIMGLRSKFNENEDDMINENKDECIGTDGSVSENSLENDFSKETCENLLKIKKELEERCSVLESSVELLREEYERCEDYWANKLEEERNLFDQEQKNSNANFQELLAKMSELEEQFASQDKLPVIDENSLEKQFTDLEEDYEAYKSQAESELQKQQNEITILEDTIRKLQQKKEHTDIGIQSYFGYDVRDKSTITDLEQNNKDWCATPTFTWGQTSKFSTSQPNSFDSQVSYDNLLNSTFSPQLNISNSTPIINTELNNSFSFHTANQSSETPVNVSKYSCQSVLRSRKHSTSSSEVSYRKDEIKRLRNLKHQLDADCKALLKQKEDMIREVNNLENTLKTEEEPYIHFKWKGLRPFPGTGGSKQTCRISIGALQDLNTRLQQLDQRRQHLQQLLRKQRQQAESMLHQSWLQHRGEISDMQYMLKNMQEKYDQQSLVYNELLERLARTDILAKDLYIENSYLIATVQRLEHRHTLTRCNANGSSV